MGGQGQEPLSRKVQLILGEDCASDCFAPGVGRRRYPSEARLIVARLDSPRFHASLAAGVEAAISDWEVAANTGSRYGLNLRRLAKRRALVQRANLRHLLWQGTPPPSARLGNEAVAFAADLRTVRYDEIMGVRNTVTLLPEAAAATGAGANSLRALCVWFDVSFNCEGTANQTSHTTSSGQTQRCVVLSTAPHLQPTHWFQTMIALDPPMQAATPFDVTVTMSSLQHGQRERGGGRRVNLTLTQLGQSRSFHQLEVVGRVFAERGQLDGHPPGQEPKAPASKAPAPKARFNWRSWLLDRMRMAAAAWRRLVLSRARQPADGALL